MKRYRQRVDRALEAALSATESSAPDSVDSISSDLLAAMRYSTFNGGKRIRPVLVYLTARSLNIHAAVIDQPACAVELIHCYSLVHDDMPPMDNDDLRRGQPTCHKQFSDATALLTGDALQTLAFEVLSNTSATASAFNCKQQLAMISTLASASGINGMAGGQAQDLSATGKHLQLQQLKHMHEHKTGALIRASIRLGALTHPEVGQDTLEALDLYARNIGLSFQIKDDILDVESDTQTLGKQQGADINLNKATYPALLGMDNARTMAQQCHQNALDSLSRFDHRADPLRWLSEYIITRDH